MRASRAPLMALLVVAGCGASAGPGRDAAIDAPVDGSSADEPRDAKADAQPSFGSCSSGWCQSIEPPTGLRAMWGSGPDDVWVVGGQLGLDEATAFHWDGASWTPVPTGTNGVLTGVWGSGPSDVWAVGTEFPAVEAMILHWDGAAWRRAAGFTASSGD
ncbi:MAG TPA: hypothetical protein VHK47_05815, partial [Polyangia bacterium]|nr:hypothetical protein [Polyangia bacterium]